MRLTAHMVLENSVMYYVLLANKKQLRYTEIINVVVSPYATK